MGGANDHRVIRLLRALLAFPRVLKLYPAGHARVEAQVAELSRFLDDVFGGRKVPLTFQVRGVRVELNDEPVTAAPEITSDLAYKLRRRRIRSLILLPGIERSELKLLAELLCLDARDLARSGGAHAFFARSPHPHLQVSTFRGDGDGEDTEDEQGIGQLTPLLAERMRAPETITRFEQLQRTLERSLRAEPQSVAHVQGNLDKLLLAFFARPEWEAMEADALQSALLAFLEIVEHTLDQPALAAILTARVESLRSFFRGVTPQDLTRGSAAVHAGSGEQEAYSTEKVRELLAAEQPDAQATLVSIRRHLEFHSSEETALLILCELLVTAETPEEFHERRHMFLSTIAEARYSSTSVARVLRHIAIDMPPVHHESREQLIQAVFDNTRDEEAVLLLLASMTDRPELARPIVKRLSARANPFQMLVRILATPLLRPFRHVATERLLEVAREKKQTLARWARQNRELFFRPEIFGPLFAQGTAVVGPICKEILTKGSPADRQELVRRLAETGSDSALRLLLLGLAYGDDGIDQELVRALGRFKSPLAAGILADIVFRANVRKRGIAEASTAMKALQQMASAESVAFLQKVARARSAFLPLFRRDLRQMALSALQETTATSGENRQ
ncbi:MAG: hypothetical protein L6Q95_07665 [Planctomycetes bacterium]|nr:hypothetical protein [Planctomycetota bacterium]